MTLEKEMKLPGLAEDLTQETFVRIWLGRSRLGEVNHFAAFVYKISRHLAIDAFPKKVLTRLDDDFFDTYFTDGEPDVPERVELKALEMIMHAAIERLPPQLRRVYTLHRINELSHEEMAREEQISRVSSRTYMARALVQLRAFLAEYNDGWMLLAWFIFQR